MRVLPRLLVCCLALGLLAAPAADAAEPKRKAPTAKQCKTKAIKKLKGAKKKARVKACKQRAADLRKRRAAKPRPRPVVAPPVAGPPAPVTPPRVEGGIDDAVVVAVLDGGLNPYHWDNLASKMPQATNAIAGDELPLNRPATEWLPGFADAAKGFAEFLPLRLSLDARDPEADAASLFDADAAQWAQVKESKDKTLNAYWFPGTKVIGATSFSAGDDIWAGVGAHGVGTTSSAVGNVHGTCGECLLFFIDYGDTAEEAEQAIEWAEAQPWIDVISNSYGHGGAVPKVYAGSNVEAQRAASDRGQTITFSAGNGVENAYVVTNPTTYSSQKGPDWLITVGAVAPGEGNFYEAPDNGGSFFGAGKPVDVSGVGSDYPNAYTAKAVGGTGTSGFGGTSNASPTIAGLYGRALYQARKVLPGPSKIQSGGVIATGSGFTCAAAHAGCELADGKLTATELRLRLLHSAVHTDAGISDPLGTASTPAVDEQDFMTEGHGSYFARQAGPASSAWLEEFERIVAPMEGRAKPLVRPDGEAEWFVVDSYCRQENWGAWTGGYFVEGQTELPAPSPDTPVRNGYAASCPGGPTPGG